MLDALGLAKTAADLLPRAWTSWQERRDPVRAQAARVIRAFEAHDIARTQIARLLPPEFSLPMTAFANPQSLREKLTPAFLDWVANLYGRSLLLSEEFPLLSCRAFVLCSR
ncbi:hypothetical protein C0V76_19115 [Uliginosibacterium sp. TH139]|nr:hypothetical protein C0V76_19115 [Uliginosibacterium sp. TH139]